MIFESVYWKEKMKRTLRLLEKDLLVGLDSFRGGNSEEKVEKFLAAQEIVIFTLAYSARKLIDSNKISSSLSSKSVKVTGFKNIKRVTFLNNHRIDELYDRKKPCILTLEARYVFNQLIHSYIFLFETRRNKLHSICFVSDRDKNKILYKLALKEFTKLLKEFANNYPHTSTMLWNQRKCDYDVDLE